MKLHLALQWHDLECKILCQDRYFVNSGVGDSSKAQSCEEVNKHPGQLEDMIIFH